MVFILFCSLPSRLEGPSTPKIELVCSLKNLLTTYKTSQGHNPDNHNMNLHRFLNLKSPIQ
jgi:hypothetical protein